MIPNSWLRFFIFSIVSWFSLPLFAADRNFTEYEESTFHNACERLLDADLSGHFVVTSEVIAPGTNQKEKHSQVIQLRRLGQTSAYAVSTASLELAATGIRELNFIRNPEGWLIGDPNAPSNRVNILSIQRQGGNIEFVFEDINNHLGLTYTGVPAEDRKMIQGDILNPNQWIVRFDGIFSAEIQFTRVKLDKSFEQAVSQSLKSLLATRLDPGESGVGDFIITVEMKKPLTIKEAEEVLGSPVVYPLDAKADSNAPFYRFAVPIDIPTLLESIGQWTRHWEVGHIDAVPSNLINKDIVVALVNRVKSVTGNTSDIVRPAPAAPATRNLSSFDSREERPTPSNTALDHLDKLARELNPKESTVAGVRSTVEPRARDLDEDSDHDGDENDHNHRE